LEFDSLKFVLEFEFCGFGSLFARGFSMKILGIKLQLTPKSPFFRNQELQLPKTLPQKKKADISVAQSMKAPLLGGSCN